MKTVTSTLLLTVLISGMLGVPADAAPQAPKARLLDMYALKEGDSYIVHILADGDITGFLSNRKPGDATYKLTLDVPALSPLDSKYDVETPFSRRFQVWPMQLDNKIYSRVEIELDTVASSVVGVENPAHIFVRIQRTGAAGTAPPARVARAPREPATRTGDDMGPVAITPLGVLPVEPPPSEDSDGEPRPPRQTADSPPGTAEPQDTSEGDGELFFNLFPTPAGDRQTLFNVSPAEDILPSDPVIGIRVGRFALQPSVDASYVRGSNLLLQADDIAYEDQSLMVRGRIAAVLLDSVNDFKIAFEGRHRQFEKFDLPEPFTTQIDVGAKLMTTPTTSLSLDDHFVRGSFESQEFDPGGEVVASTDPFYRNLLNGTFAVQLSERLGGELTGSFNRVEFLETVDDFFSYDGTTLGGSVLYHLNPLTSLVGDYQRTATNPAPTRPEAESSGNVVQFGLRGELTSLLRGRVRAGYANQDFSHAVVPLTYSGLVADVALTRQFGEKSALDFSVGRRTNLSAYEQNAFYVSNYATVRFVVPLADKLRLSANGVMFGNDYPIPDLETGLDRDDRIFSGAIGAAYFWNPLSYFSVDYRHDRRSSTVERFGYRNNALQFMVGFGFLTR